MASKVYYFEGTLNWCKVRTPDPEYNNYQVEMVLSPASKELFDASGLRLKVKETEDGLSSVKFRRSAEAKDYKTDQMRVQHPPELICENTPENWNGLVGNGSQGVVKVEVYDSKKGKGHRLIAVKVTDLVEYGANDEAPEGVLPF